MAAVRVLLADDHELFRGGLALMLRDHGAEVVGEAATAEEALRLVPVRRPDVVVMDLRLPGMNGIEATRVLCAEHPGTPVLILTASADDQDLVDALLAGAAGYLLKDAPIDRLLAGLHDARDGDAPISPRLARRVVERLRDERSPVGEAPPKLSDRELVILGHVVEGRDNAEIAAALFLSPSTVKNHVSAILRELGVDNRVQAAVKAVRLGLVAA